MTYVLATTCDEHVWAASSPVRVEVVAAFDLIWNHDDGSLLS